MAQINSSTWLAFTRLESFWAAAICFGVVAAGLFFLGNPPEGPAVFPDEVCRLGWARLLSGAGPHFDMSLGAYCQPYYALVLAPVVWLTEDPGVAHAAVFAINSTFAAVCLPLAVRLGIRHFGLEPAPAWLAGFAILAYPALTFYSHHALPETALFAAVLTTFALWCSWVERPCWRRFTLLMAMSLVLFALHRKMLLVPLALLLGAIAGYWVNRTPEYRMRALLTALALTIFFAIDLLVQGIAKSTQMLGGDSNALFVASRALDASHLRDAITRASGVFVYATLMTGGCIWLVIGGGMNAISRGFRNGLDTVDDFDRKLLFPFGLVLLLVGVSAIYFSSQGRFDTWFYGRHVDSALAASLLPAIAMIARRRAGRQLLIWIAALIAAAITVLIAFLPGPPWADFSQYHVVGAGKVFEWLYAADSRGALLMQCSAILFITSALVLIKAPGRLRFLSLVPLAAIMTGTHLFSGPFRGVTFDVAVPAPAQKVLNAADPCHISWHSSIGGRLHGHQFSRIQYYFPHCSIELFSSDQKPAPGSLIVQLRAYADCRDASRCLDLHPGVVLYRSSDIE